MKSKGTQWNSMMTAWQSMKFNEILYENEWISMKLIENNMKIFEKQCTSMTNRWQA